MGRLSPKNKTPSQTSGKRWKVNAQHARMRRLCLPGKSRDSKHFGRVVVFHNYKLRFSLLLVKRFLGWGEREWERALLCCGTAFKGNRMFGLRLRLSRGFCPFCPLSLIA